MIFHGVVERPGDEVGERTNSEGDVAWHGGYDSAVFSPHLRNRESAGDFAKRLGLEHRIVDHIVIAWSLREAILVQFLLLFLRCTTIFGARFVRLWLLLLVIGSLPLARGLVALNEGGGGLERLVDAGAFLQAVDDFAVCGDWDASQHGQALWRWQEARGTDGV